MRRLGSIAAVASCRHAHGAPTRTKVPAACIAPAHATVKEGKTRFSMREALLRDRERIQSNKSLPWRERLGQLRDYPWRGLVVFMVAWSWAGTYVVPKVKELRAGQYPVLPHGAPIPDDVKSKMSPTPEFEHLVRREREEAARSTNRGSRGIL